MRIAIGSKNKTKVDAVAELATTSDLWKGAEVTGREVVTEEFGHPITLPVVIKGAIDRARQAFQDCDYGVGIEGGLMEVPETKTGYMEVAVCAIYDGKRFYLGLSPAHEWPQSVIDLIVKEGRDGSQAFREAGLTTHEKVGTTTGGVWILTKGKIDRKEYNKLAVMMALLQLENKSHY
jgi:inosine/xanthosine triphosphatase